MSANHTNLVNLTVLKLSQSGLARVWPNQSGVGRALKNNQVIKFGLKGSADILGLTKDGLFLAVEIKVNNDKQSTEQINFMNMVINHLGIYLLIKEEDDPVAELHRAILARDTTRHNIRQQDTQIW